MGVARVERSETREHSPRIELKADPGFTSFNPGYKEKRSQQCAS
jgi:hypothetical protein